MTDASDRQSHLLRAAREYGRIDVAEMSTTLATAKETLRRDLRELETLGLVRRVRGGAVPVERLTFESTISMRSTRRVKQKTDIARAAVSFLDSAEVVFIDEGFLPQLIARALPDDRPLTVVTTDLQTALLLNENPAHTVLVVGGRLRTQTAGCTDNWAVDMLGQLVVDVGFVGGNGISVDNGVTVLDSAAAATKQAAMRACRRRILVGDSSKFGRDSFVRFARLSEFERVITDDGVPPAQADAIRAAGVTLCEVH